MSDYVPHRDMELAGWATRLANATSAAPGDYGLSEAQAAEYAAAQAAYIQALTFAMQPDTRTKPAVQRKNTAKAELIALARKTVGTVQSYTGTTDAMRVELGINVRKKRSRAAGDTPPSPRVRVVETVGGRITFEVRSGEDDRRRRPAGARGYTWFYAVGETCPQTLAEWTFGGNALEARSQLSLPGDTPPGTWVWFVANWFNGRMKPGPVSKPVQTRVCYAFTGHPGIAPGTNPGPEPATNHIALAA